MDELADRSLPEVLYAEDDVLVSEGLVASLEEAGYKVTVATNGTEARIKLNELSASLVAFISDVNLGGGPDGWELGHIARELNPALPVVYTSGQTEAEWASHGVPNSVFIGKPFAPAQVVVAVSTLLNVSGSA